jgi:hypothetical protein
MVDGVEIFDKANIVYDYSAYLQLPGQTKYLVSRRFSLYSN